MATQNILPTLQADEKSAQMRLHPVPVPNGLYDTGRMLTDAGQGLQKASFGLMLGLKQREDKLQAEQDDLALNDALNNITAASTKYATELMKNSGAQTDGSTQKFDDFMQTALGKYGAGLSPRAYRIYNQRVASLRLSLWSKVQGHEFSNMRAANIQGIQGQIENLKATWQLTQDPAILQEMLNSYDELYATQFGGLPDIRVHEFGRRYNPETGKEDGLPKNLGWLGVLRNKNGSISTELSRGYDVDGKEVESPLLNPYTAEYADQILNGEITQEIDDLTLKWAKDRIAQNKSPFYDGDREDKSLRILSDEQKRAERNIVIYQQGRQNIIDDAAGSLFDKLAAENKVDEMWSIYNNFGTQYGLPVSDMAKVRMKQVLDQKTEEKVVEDRAQGYLVEINSYGGDYAEGGTFNTDEQDVRTNELINMLEASGNKEDKLVAARLRTLRHNQVIVQKGNLGSAISQNIADLFHGDSVTEWERDLWVLRNRLDNMPFNPVKATLEQYYAENEKKLEARYLATHKLVEEENLAYLKAQASQKAADAKKAENDQKAADADAKAHAESRTHKMNVARIMDDICAKAHTTGTGYFMFGDAPSSPIFVYKKNGQIDMAALNAYLNFNSYEFGGELLPEERQQILHLVQDQAAVLSREKAINRVTTVLSSLINDGVPQNKKISLDRNTVSLAVPDLVDYVIDIQREWSDNGEIKEDTIAPKINQAIINYFRIYNSDDEALWSYLRDGVDPRTGRVNYDTYNTKNFRKTGIPQESQEQYDKMLEEQQTLMPYSTDDIKLKNKENILRGE